ncbi:MAG: hypothetical protein AABX99_02475 [Nanoarchaeota archaeon]
MVLRYGIKDCDHQLRYRSDGWEEECVPAICIKCGAFGCGCDAEKAGVSKEVFFKEDYTSVSNPNGKWENPYVRAKKEVEAKGLAKLVQ